MSRYILLIAILATAILGTGMVYAQTTLIDPSGDGGFETGTDFPANGWSVVNDTQNPNRNQYYVGYAPTQHAGSLCAFISNSSTNWTSANQAAYRHIYRDVSFPANASDISLSFFYKLSTLDSTNDGFRIYLCDPGYTPTTNSYPTGTQIGLTWYDDYTTWTQQTINLDASIYAGTNKRLVITWRNNNSNPRGLGALDNISLTYVPLPANPSSFTATASNYDQIDLSWVLNGTPDNVLLAWNTSNTFGTPSGSYSPGSSISGGGSVLLYNSNSTSFNHTGRNPETNYYYKVWSLNGAGPTYSSGVTSNATTPYAPISAFPWTETFETSSTTRSKWTQIKVTGTKSWTYATGAGGGSITTAHNGTLNARFTGSSGGPWVTKLVSPVLNLSTLTSAQLRFWYGQEFWSPDQNELKVYYRQSIGSSWVQLAHYTSNIASWAEVVLSLPNLSSTYQIAFEGIDRYGRPNVVDDVVVEVPTPIPGVSETALAFGVTDLTSGSSAREFRFYNLGYGVLNVQGMILYGNDSDQFELVDDNDYPISLEADEYISVQLYFKPTVVGAKNTNLYVQDDLGKNLYAIPVSGHGAIEKFRDGFESETNFSLSFYNWTQHDGDGYATYTISGVTFTNKGYTGSYIAFNPSATSPALSSLWNAYNGSKYAACMAATTAPNNDWLISQAISCGNNPVISFYAKSITSAYGLERFKVLYSTTGNNYVNFTTYLAGSAGTYVEAPTSWTNYTYVLPPDCANTTVYIAIQCVSNDAFSFQVDDFVAGDYGSPQFYVSPTNYEFPEFFINYTRSKQFTIANNGGGTMQIVEGGISFSSGSSPYFKLKDLPALPLTLNGGESTTFTVTYNSDREATHSATLSIIDNLSKATHTVAISGITTDNTITQKPYMEGFEPSYEGGVEFQVQGWVRRDSDADGYNWLLVNSPTMAKSGNWLAASQSWVSDAKNPAPGPETLNSKAEQELLPTTKSQRSAQAKGALTPNNWLISPPITISAGDSLSYWIGGYNSTWFAEHYALVVSTTGPEADQFTDTLLEETLTTDAWGYRAFSLNAYDGQTIYFAFRHYNCTDQLALRIDDFKLKANNTEIYQDYVGDPVEGNNYFKITMQQEILDENFPNTLLVVAEGWLSAASTALVNGSVGYGEPQQYIENAGLTVQLSGVNLSGARLRITHNLDFIPLHLAYRTTEGSYGFVLPAQASVWSDTQADFVLPSLKAGEGLEIVFPNSAEATLPVELSTFAVSISASYKVQLLWVTQSETNLLGYRVYRGRSDDFAVAALISGLIPATNTSQQQTYIYEDKELNETGFYYYWLEHQELAGDCHLHGPVTINFSLTTDGTPEIPVVNGFSSIYPNPFNPSTRIRYGLEQKSDYSLKVYNLKGQVVRTLELGSKDKGYYTADWNGRDDNNSACSSGVYFFVLQAGTQSFSRKAILAK